MASSFFFFFYFFFFFFFFISFFFIHVVDLWKWKLGHCTSKSDRNVALETGRFHKQKKQQNKNITKKEAKRMASFSVQLLALSSANGSPMPTTHWSIGSVDQRATLDHTTKSNHRQPHQLASQLPKTLNNNNDNNDNNDSNRSSSSHGSEILKNKKQKTKQNKTKWEDEENAAPPL